MAFVTTHCPDGCEMITDGEWTENQNVAETAPAATDGTAGVEASSVETAVAAAMDADVDCYHKSESG